MTVVVGVDHTTESAHALDVAVYEAELRGADLRIVHAGEPTAPPPFLDSPLSDPLAAGIPTEATAILEEALARARRTLPVSRTTGAVVPGRAAKVLIDQVTDLDLLIVGSRNLGATRSVLLGSVGSAVCSHAPCPVVVVRRGEDSRTEEIHRVLAGNDGSAYAEKTLEFAFAEAQLRGVPLDVVYCWRQHGFLTPYERRLVTEHLREEMEVDLAHRMRRYPGVEAATDVFEGRPAEVLIAWSDAATLLVVGARGTAGGAGSFVLGSVSLGVLHHAGCPVVVVRPSR